MPFNKIHALKSIFTTNGAGCGCRLKATDDVIEPQPKSKSDQTSSHLPSSSINDHSHTIFSKIIGSCPKLKDSVAVVKDSDDPYEDFRQSMLEMIFEKEIFSRDDLQQLLECFLKLNSPRHHEVIVQAFIEIWNGGGGGKAPPCLE